MRATPEGGEGHPLPLVEPRRRGGKSRGHRNCRISAPAPSAGDRSPGEADGPWHAGIDLTPDPSPVTPSACTAAPAVSPPATTSRRTPRIDDAARDLRHDAFDIVPAALGRALLDRGDLYRAAPAAKDRPSPSRGPPGERLSATLRPAAAAIGSILKTGARASYRRPAPRSRSARSGQHRRLTRDFGSAVGAAAIADEARARRKFSGSPSAIPEPPVISAKSAAASPIASRSWSATASTIAWRKRACRSAAKAPRSPPAPGHVGLLHQPDPARSAVAARAPAMGRASGSADGPHSRLRQQHVADEQVP